MFKILVVEDEPELNRTLCSYLKMQGYEPYGALCVEDAFEEIYKNTFDIIISDIMMPEINGFEFAATVREQNKSIPIIFVSARDDMPAKEKGFSLGIDDYMVKPIDLGELVLRIKALLRRANIASSRKIVLPSLTLDSEERSAVLFGGEIPLTAREFDLIYKLLSYPKKTFTRSRLMEEFWDIDSEASTRTVDVYMTKLRQKFSDCPDFEIQTVHGLGYKAVLK